MAITPLPEAPLISHVMEPHSGLDAFHNAVRSMRTDVRQAGRLAWRFFVRDTAAGYRQSLLGYVWLVFPPLANTVVWVFLDSQEVIQINSGKVAYPLFVLSGAILWAAFNGSVMSMLGVVNSARGLLAKVNFPHESLVYSAFLTSAVDALIASVLLLPAVLMFDPHWRPEMLLFAVALFGSLMVGTTIGLLLLPIGVLYSDVSRAVQLVLRFGFFVSPVIFQVPRTGLARSIMLLNPITPIIVSGRSWLTGSAEAMPRAFIGVVVACFFLFAIGLLVYKVAVPHLVERLGT